MNEEHQENIIIINTVQIESTRLRTDKHAWSSPALSVCMLPHAGSDNGWTWPSLWQSAALRTEPGNGGGQGTTAGCVVVWTSGQWAGVDS